MVPAPGQAAIALQVREADLARYEVACDSVTAASVDFERAVLATMGGGCQVAAGIHRKGDSLFTFHKDEHSQIDLSGMPRSSALERALSTFRQE